MRIEGEYIFHAPRHVVYELLQDPVALEQAMPGATTLTQIAADTYEAQVDVRIGVVGGTFNGTVRVRDQRQDEHFLLVVEGQGAAGFLEGQGTINLADVQDGTHIHYAGETKVGGKIAQVGQRLVQSAARKLISNGLASLEALLEGEDVPAAPQPIDPPTPDTHPEEA